MFNIFAQVLQHCNDFRNKGLEIDRPKQAKLMNENILEIFDTVRAISMVFHTMANTANEGIFKDKILNQALYFTNNLLLTRNQSVQKF